MIYYIFTLVAILCCFSSCEKSSKLQDLFPVYDNGIVEDSINVNPDDLGYIEGLHCDDMNLITLDFYDSKSYSLFDIATGKLKKRFGEIGHGREEIPLGCVGCIWNDFFCVFDDQTCLIAKYRLTSSNSKSTYDTMLNYQIADVMFTKIIPVDSTLFIGMGVYKDQYQYVVFNNKNEVLNYAFEIYNARDEKYDKYHKFLSNQGHLVKHPTENLFAGAILRSSNINFFSLENNKIKEVSTLKYHDPLYESSCVNGMRRVIPSAYEINGFLDICGNERFVFALYSEEKQQECPYYSNIILVFDWNGQPVCQIRMPNDIYYIAVNSTKLYTVEKNSKEHFIIKCYSFNFKQI